MRDFLFDTSGKPAAARLFSWGETGQIYRHTTGGRVLVDWDGPGRLEVLRAPSTVHLQNEHGASELTAGSLEVDDHAVLFSSDPGEFLAVARSGAEAPSSGFELAASPVTGCGWVMTGAQGLVVDDLPIHFPEKVPIPFWRGCSTEEPMQVLTAETTAAVLDRFSISDAPALKERGWKAQNMSDIFPLKSLDSCGQEREGIHASHLNVATWQVELSEPCRALLIRKTYDRFHGRQRARVMVNGDFAAWWYEPGEDRVRRWASSQVVFSSPHLSNPGPLTLSVDPPSGTALWDVSEYEIWTIR